MRDGGNTAEMPQGNADMTQEIIVGMLLASFLHLVSDG
jgi:hypothetical protein